MRRQKQAAGVGGAGEGAEEDNVLKIDFINHAPQLSGCGVITGVCDGKRRNDWCR